ncbi:MAG: PAS domain S-box protein [Candidatus Accumulibacter sp.]|jgi:two-component system sensor histidine kinase DctS|nr:PAS domain S-box protein [Accumulibacter sp.]
MWGRFQSKVVRPQTSLKWSNWYLIALKLAIGLLIALLIALFWLLRQDEVNEQRSTLIADVLWLEQSVSFHLEVGARDFQQLANDLSNEANPLPLFRLRSEYLLKSSPDILQIVWMDANGAVRERMPAREPPPPLGADGLNDLTYRHSIDVAHKLGKTLFTDAYFASGEARFEVYSPIFENNRFRGVLVGVYSFNALLKDLVPWWFAEKYRVRVLDSGGNTLASNSKISNAEMTIDYAIAFDPPGFGMVLKVDAYRGGGDLSRNLLAVMVIALAATVLSSLWVMRGHIQRRIAAEQARRSEHAFRKAMEDSLTIGMRARDLDGREIYVNPVFCQMVGFSESELLGAVPPMPYWAPEEIDRAMSINDSRIDGGSPPKEVEIRLMRKDGSRLDALIHEAPLIGADGRQAGWMASILDVTARNQAEELYRQQQEKLQTTSRLVTMGELASTLAHELNQPLAAIASYTAGCLNKLESGNFSVEELQTALTRLGVQAQRAGHIIRRVHDFVHKSEPKLAPCNLIEVIDDSIGLIDPAAKLAHVRITREIFADFPELMVDRIMIEQVLLNLMRNAIEAMSAPPVSPERQRLTVRLEQAGDQARISVIDWGPGIPPEIQDKLFTPFFSTKTDGMGMGLNICRSIIEFHRGRLWVEGNPEGGVILVISLPLIQP